jgi:predicted 3-demethylubiquinone-9 3-methyltransferase (glyoxalase superfamily)
MAITVTPFLMFQGKARDAMAFYVSLFPEAKVTDISYNGTGEPGSERLIKKATFSIGGQSIFCADSSVEHEFSFTPSFSFFVECGSEDQITQMFTKLSEGGTVFMALAQYGFSRRFGWISDKYGVSWQLNLS